VGGTTGFGPVRDGNDQCMIALLLLVLLIVLLLGGGGYYRGYRRRL
jgi:hypothetical protein